MPMPLFRRLKASNALTDLSEICIYKAIGHGDSEYCYTPEQLLSDIAEAAKKNPRCRLRLHTPGGDVSDGIFMYNLLKSSGLQIEEVIVDGIAASFGFVLLQFPGAKRVMNKYTRIMCHRVSGGAWGDADDLQTVIEQINSLETDLAEIISKASGLSAEDVKGKYLDGPDHWFDPDQALEARLIDEIRDGSIITDPVLPEDGPENFYKKYSNFLNHKTEKEMKLTDEVLKMLGLTNQASDLDIENAFKGALKAKDDKIADLTNKLNVSQEAAKAVKKAEFDALLNSDKKKFSPEQKTHFEAIFKNDPDMAIKTMQLMPDFQNLKEIPVDGKDMTDIPDKFKGKTFRELQATGGNFLNELKAKNKAAYDELYEKEFGKKPL